MPRPRKRPEEKVGTTAFTVRLPSDVIERVEVIRENLQAKAPFAKVTTTDVLRHLITEASAKATQPLQVRKVKRPGKPKTRKNRDG